MDRSESQFKDSNFFCIEEKIKDIEYLYVYYLVEKFAVDRVAFACFVRLLNESNLVFKNEFEKYCISSRNYSSQISFDYEELPYNYVLKAKVTLPSSLDSLSKLNLKNNVDKMIQKVVNASWTMRESDLQRVKDEIALEENINSKDIINKLRNLFYINFDKKHTALSYRYYGISSGLENLKRISLDKVKDIVLKSQRMVFFYGDSEYKRMLRIISTYKPSSKIFEVSKDDSSISTIRELISTDENSTKGLVVVFQKPKNNSEKTFLLNRLVAEVIIRSKKKENGLLGYDSYLYDDYLKLYYYGEELDDKKIRNIIDDSASYEIDKRHFEACKTEFIRAFENKFYSVDLYFDFLAKMRLCGLSTERQTYIDILKSLTVEELKKFRDSYRYVSSLATELDENREDDKFSFVKFDLKIGNIKLIEDEINAYFLRKASYFMFTYFSKKMDAKNLFISPLEASIKTLDKGSFLEISFYTSDEERVREILLKKKKLVRVSRIDFMRLKRYLKGKLSENTFLYSNELLNVSNDRNIVRLSYKKFNSFLKNIERNNSSIFLQREYDN